MCVENKNVDLIATRFCLLKKNANVTECLFTEFSELHLVRNGIKSGDYLFGTGKKLSDFVGAMNRKIGSIEKGKQANQLLVVYISSDTQQKDRDIYEPKFDGGIGYSREGNTSGVYYTSALWLHGARRAQ